MVTPTLYWLTGQPYTLEWSTGVGGYQTIYPARLRSTQNGPILQRSPRPQPGCWRVHKWLFLWWREHSHHITISSTSGTDSTRGGASAFLLLISPVFHPTLSPLRNELLHSPWLFPMTDLKSEKFRRHFRAIYANSYPHYCKSAASIHFACINNSDLEHARFWLRFLAMDTIITLNWTP